MLHDDENKEFITIDKKLLIIITLIKIITKSKTIIIIIIIIIIIRENCKLHPLKFEGDWILHPKVSEFEF